jgi:hypothetical protein
MKTSEVIRSLQGCEDEFLCLTLSVRADAAIKRCSDQEMVSLLYARRLLRDFVISQSKLAGEQTNCLESLYEIWREQDTGGRTHYTGGRTHYNPDYLKDRDAFCRDYADFLAEFGL